MSPSSSATSTGSTSRGTSVPSRSAVHVSTRTEILPATVDLYKIAADDLHDDYERGTSASQMVWIVLIGLGLLVASWAAGLWLLAIGLAFRSVAWTAEILRRT